MTCEHCEEPIRSRGLCERHYQRLQRYGDPLSSRRVGKPGPPQGLGYIRCNACGVPTRDHQVGPPCPVLMEAM